MADQDPMRTPAQRDKGALTVQELQELVRKGKAARSRFEPDWFLNIAYFSGNQWVFWNRGRLYQPQLEAWRTTFTDNRIIGIVRTEVAKMTKQMPVFTATPTSGDESDINAAQLGERIMEYLWRELDLQRKQRSALQWSRICGAGFWKVYWDSSAGKSRDFLYANGKPLTGPDGAPLAVDSLPAELDPAELQAEGATVKAISEGQVCIEVRSPFELIVDPLAGDEGLSSAEWVIEETVQSPDWVKKRFGFDAKEDADAMAGLAESRMAPGFATDTNTYKGVRVYEYWAQPTAKFPKGRYVVWCNDKILKQEDNPYNGLPYVMFTGIPVPGRFWPTSIVEQLRGPQTEFNKTRSQIRESAARIGNPAVLISRFSNVEYTGVPGEQIHFDDTTQNAVPSFLQAPEMPAYVQNEVGLIEASFREISGQHEVTSGSVPSGVTAASAINLLQEQDDTRLGPDIHDMERSIAQAGTMVLELVARYYADQRTVKLAGDDNDWDVFNFRGAMLRGNTTIDVQAGSAVPQSKAAKMATMETLLNLFIQNGVPMSRRELGKYLRDMEVAGLDRLIDQFSADEVQINRENRMMAQGETRGQPLPVNTYDDDQAHVDGHTTFQKSIRYQNLPPELQAVFEAHVKAHRDRMAMVQQQQQMQELQMQQVMHEMSQPPQNDTKELTSGNG